MPSGWVEMSSSYSDAVSHYFGSIFQAFLDVIGVLHSHARILGNACVSVTLDFGEGKVMTSRVSVDSNTLSTTVPAVARPYPLSARGRSVVAASLSNFTNGVKRQFQGIVLVMRSAGEINRLCPATLLAQITLGSPHGTRTVIMTVPPSRPRPPPLDGADEDDDDGSGHNDDGSSASRAPPPINDPSTAPTEAFPSPSCVEPRGSGGGGGAYSCADGSKNDLESFADEIGLPLAMENDSESMCTNDISVSDLSSASSSTTSDGSDGSCTEPPIVWMPLRRHVALNFLAPRSKPY